MSLISQVLAAPGVAGALVLALTLAFTLAGARARCVAVVPLLFAAEVGAEKRAPDL